MAASRSCHSGDVAGHVLRGVRWVVFDVGETLVDESRLWEAIAEQCGVSVATVCGVLGGLIERGESHHRLWDVLGVERVDPRFRIEHRDLYPDALVCIEVVRSLGIAVGIAKNCTSARWKPLTDQTEPVTSLTTCCWRRAR